jgi:hypothetical protein
MHEEDAGSNSFGRAHALLAQAEIVCFLGFGYHPTNMGRLKVHEHYSGTVYGSAYGLESQEVERAKELIRLDSRLGDFFEDTLRFIRRNPVLV